MTNNTIDKIAWEMLDFAKETTKKNFVAAVNNGQLKLDPATLPTILSLIDSSINEGYNKNYKNFSNRIQNLKDLNAGSSLKKRK